MGGHAKLYCNGHEYGSTSALTPVAPESPWQQQGGKIHKRYSLRDTVKAQHRKRHHLLRVQNRAVAMEYFQHITKLLATLTIDEIGFIHADPPAPETAADARLRAAFQLLPSDAGPSPGDGTALQKLGIAFHAIPPLYEYALTALKAMRRSAQDVAGWSADEVRRALDLTQAVVLINAECYTAWTVRKAVLVRHAALWPGAAAELPFVALVLRKHPKSEEAWSHRQWLVKRLAAGDVVPEREFRLCEECGERHPRNYYAWAHRAFVASRLAGQRQPLLRELRAVRTWTRTHISDGSGFCFMQHLLVVLEGEGEGEGEGQGEGEGGGAAAGGPGSGGASDVLGDGEGRGGDSAEGDAAAAGSELSAQVAFVNALLQTYRHHESMWLHKRWLCARQLRRGGAAVVREEWAFAERFLISARQRTCAGDALLDPVAEAATFAFALAFCLCLCDAVVAGDVPVPAPDALCGVPISRLATASLWDLLPQSPGGAAGTGQPSDSPGAQLQTASGPHGGPGQPSTGLNAGAHTAVPTGSEPLPGAEHSTPASACAQSVGAGAWTPVQHSLRVQLRRYQTHYSARNWWGV